MSAFAGDDDRARLGAWLGDPRVTRGFAHLPEPASAGAVDRWIDASDGRAAVLLAIREGGAGGAGAGDGGEALGFWHVRADRRHRRAEISVALGERGALGRNAAVETGIALFDWIFTATRTEKLGAHVLGRNRLTRAIIADWMRLEGVLVGEILAPEGGRLDVLRYGLLREEWPARRQRAATPPARSDG